MKRSVGLLIIVAGLAQGMPILLQSGVSAGESNNVTGTNILVPMLEPNWTPDQGDGSSWVSFENTGWQIIAGMGSAVTTLGNAPGPSSPNARFFQTFTDNNGTTLTGNLLVWADDTAAVYLDGALLMGPNFTQGMANCSLGITCIGAGTLVPFSVPSGTHTLEFDVYQTGSWTYGLMYDGTVTDNAVATLPEPGAFVLFGTGLAVLALARVKRVFCYTALRI
jgi:hypothetical protein